MQALAPKLMYNDPHWISLEYPLAPSLDNVNTYRNLILGTKVLLLGSTKLLLPLATLALDIVPKYSVDNLKEMDWLDYKGTVDTVITDGSLNLSEVLTKNILSHYKPRCNRLVSRSFTKKLPNMKYASYFPLSTEFENTPVMHSESENYRFYIWDFV